MEGGAGADSVFLLCLFRLPAVMRERKRKKKRVDLAEEEEGEKKGEVWWKLRPQQMLIRGGGLCLDSYRPNQPLDQDRWSVERLFIVCFGVRKTAQLFATGCFPRP